MLPSEGAATNCMYSSLASVFFSIVFYLAERWVNFLFVINNNDCTLVTETFTVSWMKKKSNKKLKIIQTHIALLLLRLCFFQYKSITHCRCGFACACLDCLPPYSSLTHANSLFLWIQWEIVPMPINLFVVASSQTTTKDLLNYRNI